jgi:hypothetical protein
MRAGRTLIALIAFLLLGLALSAGTVRADDSQQTTSSSPVYYQSGGSGGYQTMSVTWCRTC